MIRDVWWSVGWVLPGSLFGLLFAWGGHELRPDVWWLPGVLTLVGLTVGGTVWLGLLTVLERRGRL